MHITSCQVIHVSDASAVEVWYVNAGLYLGVHNDVSSTSLILEPGHEHWGLTKNLMLRPAAPPHHHYYSATLLSQLIGFTLQYNNVATNSELSSVGYILH